MGGSTALFKQLPGENPELLISSYSKNAFLKRSCRAADRNEVDQGHSQST